MMGRWGDFGAGWGFRGGGKLVEKWVDIVYNIW